MTDNSRRTSDGVLVQAGILAAASMIVRIVGLLYRAPLTAIIGDEGNGYYGTAYNIYTIILMVSSYSIPSAISKLIAQKRAVGEYKTRTEFFSAQFCTALASVSLAARCYTSVPERLSPRLLCRFFESLRRQSSFSGFWLLCAAIFRDMDRWCRRRYPRSWNSSRMRSFPSALPRF